MVDKKFYFYGATKEEAREKSGQFITDILDAGFDVKDIVIISALERIEPEAVLAKYKCRINTTIRFKGPEINKAGG